MPTGDLTSTQRIQRLSTRYPEIAEETLRDFVTRMDPDYFASFSEQEISRHLSLADRLDPDHPCHIDIVAREQKQFDLVVVAYDYFAVFAMICGVLSAAGLDIVEARIYTSRDLPSSSMPPVQAGVGPRRRSLRKAGLSRRKLVDVFRVRPIAGSRFSASDQAVLLTHITHIIQLLDLGKQEEARQVVNRRLVERLSKQQAPSSGLLQSVDIRFDNSQSRTDTVLEIRSDDTPAFLYAFANALAMRNIYLTKAKIENTDGKVHDQFYVRDRSGHQLTDPHVQKELRFTAVLLKQFTHALTWAPDPTKALEAYDQFLDLLMEASSDVAHKEFLALLTDRRNFPLLARLLGASDFLWEDFLRRQHANLLPMLANYRNLPLIQSRTTQRKELNRVVGRAKSDAAKKEALNRFKDQELFRIDMKHILEPATGLADFSLALTQLAELILERSIKDCQTKLAREYGPPRIAKGRPCPFSILGVGKFGGRELGYASDIEVLFVYGGSGETSGRHRIQNSEYFERLAQELLQWIEAKQEGIFHLDVRLRPHGSKGALANALDEIRAYYSAVGLAAPFERQALIKLRHVAGDRPLGKEVEAHRESYVYSDASWDLAGALDLRRQQLKEFVKPGEINVKYSPGGLIDVEYAAQYLQLMHGHRHDSLRTPNTLEALAALVECGVLSRLEGDDLRKAYVFIRTLIDGLRMVRGHAKDLVLPPFDSDAFVFLARRLDYTAADWQTGARHLVSDIEQHMGRTRRIFEERFGSLSIVNRATHVSSPSNVP